MGKAVLGETYETLPTQHTIADGIAIRVPVPEAVEAVRRVTDAVLFVEDDLILRAMQIIESTTERRVEPAGAVGLAGLLAQLPKWNGARVGIPICGGNRDDLVDPRLTAGGSAYR